jgi:hypothetical protein
MGLLRNPKKELVAQGLVAGLSQKEACEKAGYKTTGPCQAPEVQERVKELMERAAARSELSRADILERVLEDWNTARKLGQMASALKAAELYGRDVHKMFTERKEIGGPGDFDNKSEEELKLIIMEEVEKLGWNDKPDKLN